MDIAVLSDIHSNYIALKKCIDYALSHNINRYIFLGDYLGDLGYPQKTMQIIYEMNTKYECNFIKGNKDDYWLNFRENSEIIWQDNNSTTGAMLYTYNHLDKKDLEFFQKLQPAETITIDDMPQLTICHGSPYKVNEKLVTKSARTYEIMDSIASSVILCGHTHIQNKIEHNGKMILNAGSVGVPLYSNGKTQFLLLHGIANEWIPEFISLKWLCTYHSSFGWCKCKDRKI
ncbi:metallophosphoesterase family protein [Lachnoclostridium phytofermentans]|uniref:Metallophosphoesterase n=1 Tax=Lachnoclostridium phytofermentans (strain ATCC 700394 / DSM 18823 / ISDg) TaxID=357809 RepID=A9KR03_LACP7|nr:metallophosphoesterase family protein [Lachnoclostridium phytofermentans]ABX43482.1 metallophosphoesterase [Lachnoclostridium phytofermentans ISDg]